MSSWTDFQTLEVGRTYISRSGIEVVIVAHTGRQDKPFSSGYERYTPAGRVWGEDISSRDLVKVKVEQDAYSLALLRLAAAWRDQASRARTHRPSLIRCAEQLEAAVSVFRSERER